jgi:molecular chaperone GrpE
MSPDEIKDIQSEEQKHENGPADKDAQEDAASRKKSKKEKKDSTTDYQRRLDEVNDKYLRLYSEFDNYRKRSIREKADLSKTASSEIIISLLPVLDDIDRALKSIDLARDLDAVKEGMRLISDKLYGALSQKGLEPIDAMGKIFDTDFHEAITNFPAPSEDLKGKVFDVTEKGYLLNGKVIRYAKVVVAN